VVVVQVVAVLAQQVLLALALRVEAAVGGQWRFSSGGQGGSGVVVLRVPNTAAAVFSGGVATRSYDVVGYTTYEVQATTTTGETVTFYPNAFLAEYLVVAGGGGGGQANINGAAVVAQEGF
jgi:hypothetical protein